ncbi:MAG: peptidylprolyl isomerase [Oxalobacter sp.]|nr:peptidylprolyl isomerase [Oxalobacter sp.]
MKIAKNSVVTVEYSLTDAENNLIDEGLEPIVYLHGGYDDILPALEKALDGQDVGFKTRVQVEPEDAFGEYDAMLVRVEDRGLFPDPLEIGMQFEGIPEDGASDGEAVIYRVESIAEGKVVLDGNHPLAGIALRFELSVTDVRPATDREIQQGGLNNPDAPAVEGDDELGEGGQYRSLILQ